MRATTTLLLIISSLVALSIGLSLGESTATNNTAPLPGTRTATTNIVAVSPAGPGITGTVSARIIDGTGKVMVETDPFIDTDTQLSAQKARDAAEHVTGKSLANKDVIYDFDIAANTLGGSSAGAAMAVATIAAIENRSISEKTAITGTVDSDGRIGRVSAVQEKAEATGQAGMSTFLVPHGQEASGFKTNSLNNMTFDRYGMRTQPVDHVRDAADIMIESPPNQTNTPANATTPCVPATAEGFTR